MPHSLTRAWIHGIYETLDQRELIVPSIKHQIHQMISNEFDALECPVRCIDGSPNQVQVLFRLSKKVSLNNVFTQFTGAIANKINRFDLTSEKFVWQPDYAVQSISENKLSDIKQVIRNQKKSICTAETIKIPRLQPFGYMASTEPSSETI